VRTGLHGPLLRAPEELTSSPHQGRDGSGTSAASRFVGQAHASIRHDGESIPEPGRGQPPPDADVVAEVVGPGWTTLGALAAVGSHHGGVTPG
jgi:hypothetical protein